MAYYKTCPWCGASLDPGERCSCQDEENRYHGGNHDSGKVERELTAPNSTSIV